jgi:SAM-dependent methyltransferase
MSQQGDGKKGKSAGELPGWRRWIRRARLLAPIEARAIGSDFIADALQVVSGPAVGLPVPPARRRRAIARSSSREEFFKGGALAAAELLGALSRAGVCGTGLERWLDFGCGAGRLSWILSMSGAAASLTGVDVDEAAIHWCKRNLPDGRFEVIPHDPPTSLSADGFDVVFAASVFTHFDERRQFGWLDEIRRILRPGGILLASTHRPELVRMRPELSGEQLSDLERGGFVYDAGRAGFNDGAAFHSRAYLEESWTARGFDLLSFEVERLFKLQDLSIWRRLA